MDGENMRVNRTNLGSTSILQHTAAKLTFPSSICIHRAVHTLWIYPCPDGFNVFVNSEPWSESPLKAVVMMAPVAGILGISPHPLDVLLFQLTSNFRNVQAGL